MAKRNQPFPFDETTGSVLSTLTLKAALYGRPIGKLAMMANRRLAMGDLKARLWEISCIARNRF